ncbi:MAG TPA: TRAM domain-containing protein [Candidatus Aminicenantes bacterium]|nr:TRAM domain-containing protein [Candidatus Aminicenantes bacterium]
MGIWIFRLFVIGLVTIGGYFYPPFKLGAAGGAAAAFLAGALMMALETRIRKVPFRVLWSAGWGLALGLLLGWLLGALYRSVVKTAEMAAFVRIFFLVIMPYIGLLIGMKKPEWLEPGHLAGLFKEKRPERSLKVLDTSVIIDGRIADLCDTGFVEGTLVVPRFVLKELHLVADSADPLKRQRGRRGLDVIDRLQKSSRVKAVLSDLDFPEARDVDSKIIECAKAMGGQVVATDIGLSKVARINGLEVLNINDLVNALRPVALPGEAMSVFILKEGKEKDQGVGYLEDGTMVVVDSSRRMIGQTVDITVTSVLQTTVGKMIFGRFNGGEAK